MADRCDYRWDLIGPSEEDGRMKITHRCALRPGHTADHRCACGATPDDDRTNHG